MSDDLVKRLRDLHKQATTERSHYYVARSVLDAIEYIEAAEAKLAVAEAKLEEIEAEWSAAIQGDLENGVRSLNEMAARDLSRRYPSIATFGQTIDRIINGAGGAPDVED